jgi:hypothetical protein
MEVNLQKPPQIVESIPIQRHKPSKTPETDKPISDLEVKIMTVVLATAIGVGSTALAVWVDYGISRPKTRQAISRIGEYISYCFTYK